ncbi:LuxR C-terminal-related transcriptional regulator [Lentzea sp. NPDC051213]|uniref:helix-turn-helix transcriptional regulator n=1 Tax=Lentzea sp. NPDC051213 TaxID=3364126 RepID=UPI0037B5F0DE
MSVAPIGRGNELEVLADRMASVREGHAQAVVVRGPAGIGKAALLDAVLAGPWCDDAMVLRTMCERTGSQCSTVRALFAPLGLPSSVLTPDSLHQLTVNLLKDRPLVIVLDEAQRCDTRSLRWVELLLRLSVNLPLLLLLSERTGEPVRGEAVRAEIAAHERYTTLDLAPLPSGAELGPRSGFSQAVARAITVLGTAEPELVGALAGVPDQQVAAAIDDLRANRLLTMKGQATDASALDGLSSDELADLRTRAARLLNDAGYPAGRVADQLVSLPLIGERWMIDTLRDAAHRACARDAARYLLPVLAAEPLDVDVRVELADALCQSAPPSALPLLRETLGMTSDVRVRARVALRFAQASITVQRAQEGFDVLNGVLKELESELGDAPGSADRDLLMLVWTALLLTGMAEKSTFAAVQALRIQAPAGDTPAERRLLGVLALASASGGGSVESTVAHARQALRLRQVELDGLSFLTSAEVLLLAGEFAEALDALDLVVNACRRLGEASLHYAALALRSAAWADVGGLNEGAVDARVAVRMAGREDWEGHAARPRIALASILVKQNDAEGARAVLPRLGQLVSYSPWFWMARAEIAVAEGDQEGALEDLLACGRMLDEAGIVNPLLAPWRLDAVCLLMESDQPQRAMAIAEQCEELTRSWSTTQSVARALLARGVATPGRRGIALLEEAVELLDTSPARLLHARSEYLLGRARLGLDDVKGARLHLRRAVDSAARCGYRRLAVVARDHLVLAGGRMGPFAVARVDALTESERKVAVMAANGMSNREIAESLVISVRTVETHLTGTYRKLGVAGRAHLKAALRMDPVDRLSP